MNQLEAVLYSQVQNSEDYEPLVGFKLVTHASSTLYMLCPLPLKQSHRGSFTSFSSRIQSLLLILHDCHANAFFRNDKLLNL